MSPVTIEPVATFYQRAQTWTIGSDPGLLRLRLAIRTTLALGCSLLVMFVLTRATGQPLTVALLGAVITMVASRSVNEPDPREQRITMALLPLPAALSIVVATLLAPHRLAGDIVFVVVVFIAVYIRRFGARGRALGMVGFMAYFFTLYLRAGVHEVPWMVGAVVVGTLFTFLMTAYVLPDDPDRVLRATIRSLRARMAIVVDTTADGLQAGRLDERRRRRVRARIARLNDTALMVQDRIEDKANPAPVGERLAPWLFDAELAVEWVALAGQRAALVASEIPPETRGELVAALSELARAIRFPSQGGLRAAADRAQRVLDGHPASSERLGEIAVRRLAMSIIAAATATSEARTQIEHVTDEVTQDSEAEDENPEPDTGPDTDTDTEPPAAGLRPTTRQAIQACVAAALAIVAGDRVSPDRWYWAVIAAFVVFAGTNTWGESLTKGWQRLLGTALGVPCGMLVATLFSGNEVASLVMVFVCLFCAFYFMQVTQSLMAFWITTMLALLYGLMGQFSVDVLLLRIEETAIGAVIGVAVAILVLPTNIGATVRSDTREFLTALSTLIDTSMAAMFDRGPAGSPTEQARQLDRKLQQYRATAKPLLAGVTGLAGRRSIQRSLRLFAACDRYARVLARRSEQYHHPDCPAELADAVTDAATQVRRNIDALIATLDGEHATTIISASDALDAAETLAQEHDDTFDPGRPGPDPRRHPAVLHQLRQIDRVVVAAATHLDADAVLKSPDSRVN
ncbi:FUSC family protein [Mycobacterium kiyosense]|uniref:Membrane protein n=2 Tax=Mycobacterium kiyosense TaxID=2871094 RepID=A0A9P3Q4P5_9MYCO|nr:FUSC family protein [Mycobacterium kiyosense]BDB40495.1 membrane protein [Mycobacterium kiyosense]GLB84102.1 membrane protein [Mycobacterium kiyosense]GLB88551.1 membrane protein [Mycobacterium kiyosense]GLB94820.1 membrane protein [Mycobacterium kiyosense]GLC01982.1 membrane protein [Mycobacterium kiyosense]